MNNWHDQENFRFSLSFLQFYRWSQETEINLLLTATITKRHKYFPTEGHDGFQTVSHADSKYPTIAIEHMLIEILHEWRTLTYQNLWQLIQMYEWNSIRIV